MRALCPQMDTFHDDEIQGDEIQADEIQADETIRIFEAPALWRAEVIADFRLRGDERCAAASPAPGYPQLFDSLMTVFDDLAGRWLDIGGGLGGLASWIERTTSNKVVVLDPAENSVAAARRLFPSLAAGIAEGEHLPVADATVDVVVLNGVVSLLDHLDGVLAEVRRVLVPSGRVVVTDIWSTTSQTFVAAPNTFRSLEDFTQLVRTHGYQRVHVAIGEFSTGWWSKAANQVNDEIIARYSSAEGFAQWYADLQHLEAVVDAARLMAGGMVLRRGVQ